MADRQTRTEERIAHLERIVDDLSEVVARQGQALEAAERRLHLLLQREAERAGDEGGAVFTDQRPPHW